MAKRTTPKSANATTKAAAKSTTKSQPKASAKPTVILEKPAAKPKSRSATNSTGKSAAVGTVWLSEAANLLRLPPGEGHADRVRRRCEGLQEEQQGQQTKR